MKTMRITTLMVLIGALSMMGCGDDDGGSAGSAGAAGSAGSAGSAGTGGTGGVVDTSGACGVICDGGVQQCEVEGFDPADGLESCTRTCQAQWTREQDCAGPADFVIQCVDANASCTTLDDETCGTGQTSALRMLLDCLAGSQ